MTKTFQKRLESSLLQVLLVTIYVQIAMLIYRYVLTQ